MGDADRPKRAGTVHYGDRNESRKSRPLGVPVLYECEDETGKYEAGELTRGELEERRSVRPTDTRILRLENKHDALVSVVSELRQTVGEVSGKLDVLPQLVEAVKDASDRVQEREHLTFVGRLDVDKATALDGLDAKQVRRRLVAKLLGAVLGGLSLGEVLHKLGVL